MSAISSTDAVFAEPEIFSKEYEHTIFKTGDVDPKDMVNKVNRPLSERIVENLTPQGKMSNYSVDSCLTITAPSSRCRQDQVTGWTAKQTSESNQAWSKGAYAVTSFVIMVISAIVMSQVSDKKAPLFAIGAGVGLVSGIVFAIWSSIHSSRATDAAHQVNAWKKTPENDVAQRRQDAYHQGFPYAIGYDLKLSDAPSRTRVLHASEVKYLYDTYFPKYCAQLRADAFSSSCDKNLWIRSFLSANPLSRHWMIYGLGIVPDELYAVVKEYADSSSLLNDMKNSFEEQKNKARVTCNKLIEAENKLRNAELAPLAKLRDEEIVPAQNAFDDVKKDHPLSTDPDYRSAADRFNKIKELADTTYAENAKPINEIHDKAIKKLTKELEAELSKIHEKQSNKLAARFDAGCAIMDKAEKAWSRYKNPPVYQLPVIIEEQAAGA